MRAPLVAIEDIIHVPSVMFPLIVTLYNSPARTGTVRPSYVLDLVTCVFESRVLLRRRPTIHDDDEGPLPDHVGPRL